MGDEESGSSDVALGLVLIVIGILITAVTYDSASKSGGLYVVAYGPIIVGVIKLFRGLARGAG